MRLASLLAGLLLATTLSAQQTPQPQPPRAGTGLLLGRVLDGDSTRPLADVLVTLTGAGGGPNKVYADAEGRFLFTRLPDGEFTLRATKAGYMGGVIGQRVPTGPARPVILAPGERRGDLVIRLWKYGAIAGTVTDDTGAPVVGTEVRLIERGVTEGRRVLLPVASRTATTDDRGAYRFSTVPPGEFIVLARSPSDFGQRALMSIAMSDQAAIMSVATRVAAAAQGGHIEDVIDIDGSLRMLAPTFHPAATTPEEAEVLSIRAGEERTNIDVHAAFVSAARVAGTIFDNGQPVTATSVRLMVGVDDMAVEIGSGRSSGDGRFSIIGVPAGRYTLTASRVPSMQRGMARGAAPQPAQQPVLPTDATLWTSLQVIAGDPAAASLTLMMQRGGRIRGRIDYGNSAARPTADQLAQLRVVLVPAGPPSAAGVAPVQGRVEPDGTFATAGVVAGRYRLRVTTPAPWRARSAMAGGVDMLDTPLTIGGDDIDDVALTIVDSADATIAGIVRTASGTPDPEAIVLVLPTNEALIGERRMKVARTTGAGEYTVPRLPAGDYVVAVITDEQLAVGLDREMMTRASAAGTRVTVADGERRTADLRSAGGR